MDKVQTPPRAYRLNESIYAERSSVKRSSNSTSTRRSKSASSKSQDSSDKLRPPARDFSAPGLSSLAYRSYTTPTLSDVGGSVWLSSRVFLVWRLFCAWIFAFTLGLFVPSGQFRFEWLSTWIYLSASCTMLLVTFSSLLYHLYPERSRSGRFGSFSLLVSTTVGLYQISLSLALGIDVLYWVLLKDEHDEPISRALLHIINFVLLFIDSFLSLKLVFHLMYVFLGAAIVVAWLVSTWVRYAFTRQWSYQVLNFQAVGASRAIAVHFAMVLTFLATATIILFINRINRVEFIRRRIDSIAADEFEMCVRSINIDPENPPDDELERVFVETQHSVLV
ncbi:hypothetical protein BWQ96_02446 [Gracilariopsis chorda]|uniref:Uncharacterized protein n=1 Tax=Gracilariopsis chorda TaxID=448386 RepID=A0A2V3J039_9FLOR|nr:hypothetical protein BWQ96_02446 [Gracilariopsis chorda]|eukprot:PXF47764.1 hypothetical protein BWQ96_02446 [Gracilariopsis chorda]